MRNLIQKIVTELGEFYRSLRQSPVQDVCPYCGSDLITSKADPLGMATGADIIICSRCSSCGNTWDSVLGATFKNSRNE